MSYLYERWDNNFNYYHYQPGSNIIIVYCKHTTQARVAFRLSMCDGLVAPNHDRRCFIQINTREGDPVSRLFCVFFAYKKLLDRTETQTRERMYCHSI